jgi:quinol-cytochrome oxidoreductase complex cytochrome b subunit
MAIDTDERKTPLPDRLVAQMTKLGDQVQGSQAWTSIFRPGSIFRKGYTDSPRNRSYVIMNSVLYHLHPVKVKRHAVKVSYTLCLGGLSFFLFILETVTGIFLMFFYRPTAAQAWDDIYILQTSVTFGLLVRNMHRWGAHLMVITVFLHMARVFYHGAYKPPREFNWVIGVILLKLTLLLSFTGYLLPWDQLAIWAITVGSNMARATPFLGHEGPGASLMALGDVQLVHAADDARFALLGGTFVGEGALLRFYVLHCVALPLVIGFLMAIHFWRVRKDGGISGPL